MVLTYGLLDRARGYHRSFFLHIYNGVNLRAVRPRQRLPYKFFFNKYTMVINLRVVKPRQRLPEKFFFFYKYTMVLTYGLSDRARGYHK